MATKRKPAAAVNPVVNPIVSAEWKTGLTRPWRFLTVSCELVPDKPVGPCWGRWNLPVLTQTWYIIVKLEAVGSTLLYGYIEIY